MPERHVDSNTSAERVLSEHIIDLLSCDHTLGNLLQTYIDEKLFGQNNLTYVGYNVPHPLREEMVLRLGIDGGVENDGRKTIQDAASGCSSMFTQWLDEWQKITGTRVEKVAAAEVKATARATARAKAPTKLKA